MTHGVALLRPLFDWRSAVASPFGPPATTRHVLLTLSLHMSARGDSCFPSIDLLTEESGLSRRAVIKHLDDAETLGWIAKFERQTNRGRGWRSMEYVTTMPPGVEERVKAWAAEGGARRAPPRRGAPGSRAGAPGALDVVHDVHPRSSVEVVKEGGSGRASARPASPPVLTDEERARGRRHISAAFEKLNGA